MSHFFKQSDGFLVVFDVNEADSLESVEEGLRDVARYARDYSPSIVVGNKVDVGARQVAEHDARDVAQRNNADYAELSALTGLNVEATLARMVRMAMQPRGRGSAAARATMTQPGAQQGRAASAAGGQRPGQGQGQGQQKGCSIL